LLNFGFCCKIEICNIKLFKNMSLFRELSVQANINPNCGNLVLFHQSKQISWTLRSWIMWADGLVRKEYN
jgi:hypothetical protein